MGHPEDPRPRRQQNGSARRVIAVIMLGLTLTGCELAHAIEMSERHSQIDRATRSRYHASSANDSLRAQRAALAVLVAAAEQRRASANCAAQTERARVQVARRRLEQRVVRARWLLCAASAAASELERACLIGLATDSSDQRAGCGDSGNPHVSTGTCGDEPPPPLPPVQFAEMLGIRDSANCLLRTRLAYGY